MPVHRFSARLIRPEGTGTWTYLDIPIDIVTIYGVRGRFRIRGTINGLPFRSTALPRGDGTHYLVVNQDIREAIGAEAGNFVRLEFEPDTEARSVTAPLDLLAALETDPRVRETFENMPYSRQKEYVEWVEAAKRDETRARRVAQAVEMISKGRYLKGSLGA